jgi:hypothetical protein
MALTDDAEPLVRQDEAVEVHERILALAREPGQPVVDVGGVEGQGSRLARKA